MKHRNAQEFVVDSCVFAKLFLEENDQEKALKFFNELAVRRCKIYVPSIFLFEVLNVCSVNKINEEDVFFLINRYQKFGLQIVNPSEKTLRNALKMTKIGHKKSGYPSFYDCVYHALAIELDCQFITSDFKHITKAKKFGSIKSLDEIYDE